MAEKRKVTRVLIAKPGLDGHDRGAKVVAKALRDEGMEVIYTGLRQTVDQIVMTAIQEDVQVIGLSILSGTHLPLTKKLVDKLVAVGIKNEVLILLGGNIPEKDKELLLQMGVDKVFSTGSSLGEIAEYLRNKLKKVG